MRIAQLIITMMVASVVCSGAAFAHPPGEYAHHTLGWTSDPSTLVPIIVATGWYGLGLWRLAKERGVVSVDWGRAVAFAGGIIVLVITLQSPLDGMGDELFSAHMVQHMLLMLVAPPLFVWSDPAVIFLRAFPRNFRRDIGRIWTAGGFNRALHLLMHPLIIWAAFCGGFIFWHAPRPYEWALHHQFIHVLAHLTFFVTALGFWSIVISVHGRRRLSHGTTLLFIVTAAVLSDLPGALMIFAPRPLYPGHAEGVARWGISLMQDQQLAGLIMWIPGGAAYLLAAGWLFLTWLSEAESRALACARRAATSALLLVCLGLMLTACDNAHSDDALVNFNGNAARGTTLIPKYGCGGCHLIPGIADADGNVGPPLIHVGTRTYIAGVLRNSPENMAAWIRDPQRVTPGNAMPNMDISDQDSRDITAFLYTLR